MASYASFSNSIGQVGGMYTMSQTNVLSEACKAKDLTKVRQAIQCGIRPDAQTLTWACLSMEVSIVDEVIKAGAKPDGETFVAACSTNIPAIVQKALGVGAPITEQARVMALKMQNPNIIDAIGQADQAELSKELSKECLRCKDLNEVQALLARGARPSPDLLTRMCLEVYERDGVPSYYSDKLPISVRIIECLIRAGAPIEERAFETVPHRKWEGSLNNPIHGASSTTIIIWNAELTLKMLDVPGAKLTKKAYDAFVTFRNRDANSFTINYSKSYYSMASSETFLGELNAIFAHPVVKAAAYKYDPSYFFNLVYRVIAKTQPISDLQNLLMEGVDDNVKKAIWSLHEGTLERLKKSIQANDVEMVKFLFEAGIFPPKLYLEQDFSTYGMTFKECLKTSIQAYNVEMVKLLLKAGVPPTKGALDKAKKGTEMYDIVKAAYDRSKVKK